MPESNKKLTEAQVKKILTEARKRIKLSYDADFSEREIISNDLKFLDGDQWPENAKRDRKENDRVMVTVNKLPTKINRVIGERRQNKFSITVVPHDQKADVHTAEGYEGIIRTIESDSDAEDAYDWAFECALACSRGWIRLVTDYADDETFDQDLYIKDVDNPLCVYFPPNCNDRHYLSDMRWAFVSDFISEDEYERLYPGKKKVSFDESNDMFWCDSFNKTLRRAEYFRIVDGEKKTLYKFDDGTITDKEPENGKRVVQKREVVEPVVEWYMISGTDVLEGPKIWPGKHIPLIPVWGTELNVGGKRKRYSYIRWAKESQRLYNYWRSNITEVISLVPKAPFKATKKMVAGLENVWNVVHKKIMPYILFNPDPIIAGAMPVREQPATIPTGIAEEQRFCDDEIDDTTGGYDPFVGKPSGEKSGIAIEKRSQQANIIAFPFTDNLRRAISHTGKLLVESIPRVYEPERIVRITNPDESVKIAILGKPKSNEENGGRDFYDVFVGKYDINVKVGPAYATQREKAIDGMLQFMKIYEESKPIIGDVLAKNMDWPEADEIAKRLKKLLPPGIAEEEEGEEGKETEIIPPNDLEGELEPEVDDERNVRIAQERAKLDGINKENEIKQLEIEKKKLEIEYIIPKNEEAGELEEANSVS